MLRVCPECNKASLKLAWFDINNRIRCKSIKCTAQYKFKSMMKFTISFLSSLFLTIAFYCGFFLKSWLAFLIVGLIAPLVLNYMVLKFGKLKLVGLKAELKKKGVNSKTST
jgi:hypothetical protein